jgi:hypothetical protein
MCSLLPLCVGVVYIISAKTEKEKERTDRYEGLSVTRIGVTTAQSSTVCSPTTGPHSLPKMRARYGFHATAVECMLFQSI